MKKNTLLGLTIISCIGVIFAVIFDDKMEEPENPTPVDESKINEYGGSDFSKITSLQNFLTIDLDKFEKGLKDSKHKAIYKKARKQFMKVV